MLVVAIIGVLAVIAGNRVMSARLSATEASAVASLRVINSGEANYSSTCASGHYAIDLADLSQPPAGTNSAFISPDLASNGVLKSGYIFRLAKNAEPGTLDSTIPPCNVAVATPASGYHASAEPWSTLGGRYFATNNLGTIFQNQSGALANPIPASARVVQ